MYKVSDLLGKPLLDLCEAKFLGTICNLYFDDKLTKCTFVVLFDEDEDTKFFPMNKLVNIEGDAVTVKGSNELSDGAEGVRCPINSYAFNQDGRLLGTVSDIHMDGSKVVSFLLGDEAVESGKLLSVGKVLVFNDSGKAIKVKPVKRQPSVRPSTVDLPMKTAFAPSYDFLLGKKLQRTIVARDGKVIAREGENITSGIISTAKREGKLVILALNAL